MKYIFMKGGVVVGISTDSNGLPDWDSMGSVEDFQKVDVGDSIQETIISSPEGVLSKCYTKLEFMNRFTLEEQVAIETSTNPIVKVLDKQNQSAEFIDIYDPKTQQGIGYLYNIGILTLERMNEILS